MNPKPTEEISYQNLIHLLDQGLFDACVSACIKHIEEFGDSAKVWVLMGSAFGADDNPEKARQALLCALKIDPHHENAQVNYVTSCLHVGNKVDALKSLKEFLPGMSDECLAFKMAPCLAEALERGILESTDLNPRLWVRIEKVLKSVENGLDRLDPLEGTKEPVKDNVILFPLQNPSPAEELEAYYPLAHFVFDGGEYKSATLYVENNHFHLRAYKKIIASPLGLEDSRGEACIVQNPGQLADFLFAEQVPQSISFLKLCRQDWQSGDHVFFYFESFSHWDELQNGEFLVKNSRFEEENYHFKQGCEKDVFQESLNSFTFAEEWKGFRRIGDLWSPPYLGEIVFSELKKELEQRQKSVKKTG